MFCKFCGHELNGGVCQACGKENALFGKSTELERLMKGGGVIKPPEKTYQQGLNEGYHNGVRDGYSNGLAESQETMKRMRKWEKVICAILVLCILLAGGLGVFFGTRIGDKQGYTRGLDAGRRESSQAAYRSGEDAGYQKGLSEGTQEVKAQRDEAYQEGYQAAQEEALAVIAAMSAEAEMAEKQIFQSGDQGDEVKQIQGALILLGYLEQDDDDGSYGKKTKKAIEQFQTDHELTVDGIAGPETLEALFDEADSRPTIQEEPAAASEETSSPADSQNPEDAHRPNQQQLLLLNLKKEWFSVVD